MDGFIEMTEVEFSYPSGQYQEVHKILTGVSLAIRKGEFLAIIGPNGSGKSTLVKHFNGLLTPTNGTVTVGGLNTAKPEDLIEIRRRVGMLFQNPENQLVSSIVEEDVAFGPENLSIPSEEIKQRVETSLKAVGMNEYRTELVHALSGGQKQRVAIAGLLAMQPECLVLDEPTSMLDPAGRQTLYAILRDLNKRGITIILVTHHMEEAVFADRVCIFNEGNIVLQGTPGDIFSDPGVLVGHNLELPQVNRLASILKEAGFASAQPILTVDEMVEYICTYKPKT